MTDLVRQVALWNLSNPLLVFFLVLLFPMVFILWFRRTIPRTDESQKRAAWITLRRRTHAFLLVAVAVWWGISDFLRLANSLSFWCALVGGIAVIQLTCYSLDKAFLGRRWTLSDLLRLTFWRTVFPAVALLLVAMGFGAIYDHNLTGLLWLVAAAIVAMVGMVRLRLAEGMKLQEVKSGAVYKRAFVLAKEMGTRLKRVYVVPAGRGHMTNAFGLGQSIAVTDNYGKFLHGAQLDFVIGHELAHVRERHGRKKLLIVVTVYASMGLLCLVLPRILNPFRPLFDLIVMLGPVLAFYYFARRFEYAADKAAVELTQDPETGINALPVCTASHKRLQTVAGSLSSS